MRGGATSGGGDLNGIEASRVLEQVFSSIYTLGDKLYSKAQLEDIREINKNVKVIMTNDALPVSINGIVQDGTAYSIRNNQETTIYLKSDLWKSVPTLLEREVLLHHEIMILAGSEQTGDYTYSLKFEKFRKNHWMLAEKKTIFCTINVFKKSNYYNKTIPGVLIGSSSSIMPFDGAKSDWGVLGTLENGQALIWRGVIDSNGYFRMKLDEGAQTKHKIKEFSIDFSSLKSVTDEQVFADPYTLENPVANPLVYSKEYAIVVNCNKID